MYTRNYKYLKLQSFFLLGPRGTGKSTWIKKEFADAHYIDLLDQSLYQDYLRSPQLFKEHVLGSGSKWIVVDEIQRLPDLLNYVHQIMESHKIMFVLTGSSARKLKKHSVNLLAGRAHMRKFHPLSANELGTDFNLKKSLQFGHLPQAITSAEPLQFLKSYVGIYLREEVQQEALVRNLALFSNFLETLAFSQGQILSAQIIASDVGVDRKTIESYIQVLEDLLLGYRIPVFQYKAKRKMTVRPKFFYFDVGVYRILRKKGPLDTEAEIDGPALETLCLQELKCLIDNGNYDAEIYFYRTANKKEVDFIIYGNDAFCGIEIKRTTKIRDDDLEGIRTFKVDYPKAKCFVFCLEEKRRVTNGNIYIIPLSEALLDLEKIVLNQ